MIISINEVINNKSFKKFAAPVALIVLIGVLTTVILMKRKHITVVVNGSPTEFVTYKSTVKDALKDKDITLGSKDKVSPALDAKIKDKDKIDIKRAVNLKVAVDGKELDILSAEDNVGMVLTAEGITLKDEDKVNPSKDALLSDGLKIDVIRVESKTITVASDVEFNTVVKTDSGLANTKKRVDREGTNGEKESQYNVVYENGTEVSRTLLSENITKPPVDKIVVQGTYPLAPVNRGGDPLPYSKVFTARATAYWATRGVGKTYTASGRLAVRNPDGYSTIAVDPSVIPYGTKLFIEGYGFAIAADTGTAIIGNTIDVYFNTYREACNWAVKYVKVYVLN